MYIRNSNVRWMIEIQKYLYLFPRSQCLRTQRGRTRIYVRTSCLLQWRRVRGRITSTPNYSESSWIGVIVMPNPMSTTIYSRRCCLGSIYQRKRNNQHQNLESNWMPLFKRLNYYQSKYKDQMQMNGTNSLMQQLITITEN